MTIETHPLEPFLPKNGRVLFLGSFPPPKANWSMKFFYPNWINDFWRIMGVIYFNDKKHFEQEGKKQFCRDRIVCFCEEKGLAFFDTASKVCRLKDNASDNFLEILEPTNVCSLLRQMPSCMSVITTGGKASEEFASTVGSDQIPQIGENISVEIDGKEIRWFRVPSSSRAYPMALDKKAEYYKSALQKILG